MMIQAHLHVGFFKIFFIKFASLKQFYVYMKLLQSSTILKSALRLKFLLEIFYNSKLKKIIATLCIVTIEKTELTFLLILYFHGFCDSGFTCLPQGAL